MVVAVWRGLLLWNLLFWAMGCSYFGFVDVAGLLRFRLFRVCDLLGFWMFGLQVLCGFDLFQADGLSWLDGCVLVLI